jgi:hypothetical protein
MVPRAGSLALIAVLGVILALLCSASSGPISATNVRSTMFRALDPERELDTARVLCIAMGALLLASALQAIVHLDFMVPTAITVNYDSPLFSLRC